MPAPSTNVPPRTTNRGANVSNTVRCLAVVFVLGLATAARAVTCGGLPMPTDLDTCQRTWTCSLADGSWVPVYYAASANQPCDDGNLCTYADKCLGGSTCAGTAITGSSSRIRHLAGGQEEAEALFGQLRQSGTVVEGTKYPGTLIRLPGGGQVGFRPVSTSGPPTIDVRIKGLGIREIKFLGK